MERTFKAAVNAYQVQAADAPARIDAYAASAGVSYLDALDAVRAEFRRQGVYVPSEPCRWCDTLEPRRHNVAGCVAL